MSLPFASGKAGALATCDRCGFLLPYVEMKRQIVNLKDTGLRVCPTCWEPDSPRWLVGKWPITDPQALQFGRPDLLTDRGLFGWDPVLGNQMIARVGQVTIFIT